MEDFFAKFILRELRQSCGHKSFQELELSFA